MAGQHRNFGPPKGYRPPAAPAINMNDGKVGCGVDKAAGIVNIGTSVGGRTQNVPIDPLQAFTFARAIVKCAIEAGATAPDWYRSDDSRIILPNG